jgi:hypothetical protein
MILDGRFSGHKKGLKRKLLAKILLELPKKSIKSHIDGQNL